MDSKKLFYISVATCAICFSVVAIQAATNSAPLSLLRSSGVDGHILTLDNSDTPNTITDTYQNNVSGTVKTSNGNNVTLNFVNAKKTGSEFVTLANHGKIYVFGGIEGEQITAVNGISFTGSGSLLFKPCSYKNILAEVTPISVSAGSASVTVPTCDTFEIEAGDSGVVINQLTLNYDCNPLAFSEASFYGTYTGLGTDGYTYKLTITDGTDTLQSLDKASNVSYSGSVTVNNKMTLTFSGNDKTYSMTTNGYQLIGTAQSGIPAITFDKVYKVENFELYTDDGQGYTSSTTKYQTQNLRSQFYADYYTGSGSGEIGGAGWPVMTSTDNTKLLTTGGHSGKAGVFKFSNGTSMRYISMNSLYGVDRLIGKGSTLSFWARGAFTNTSFNTNHSSNIPMKVYAYYATPLTSSNQASVRETLDFTVNNGSTWQHFELPLTAGREYYGFGIYAQQSSGSTAYVPFDDFEIYTASPYAEYVPPVAVTGVSVSPTALNLETGQNGQLTATVSPSNATNKGVTWTSNNTSVATVSSDGLVSAVSAGNATITVTTADGGYTATCAVTVTAYVPYPEGTFTNLVSVPLIGATFQLVVAIGNRNNGLIAVRLSNTDGEATGITYNDSTMGITITTNGSFEGYSIGNITGTFDPTNNRIINVKCNGSIGSYVSKNGSITISRPADNSISYFADCDGTTSELQAKFKRRYMSGSWQVDNSNADRITSNTTELVSGSSSVKRRGYSGGAVALNFNNDFSSAKTITSAQFWVYNPSNSDISLRTFGYKATSFGNNFEAGTVTAKARQWTYVTVGFNSAAIYNFQIADFNNTGEYLSFDNIYLFSKAS